MPVLGEKRGRQTVKNCPNLNFFFKNVLTFNLNASPFYEKNHHFAPFGLYRQRAPRGPSRGASPKQFFYNKAFLPRCPKKNFSPFCSASPEIIGVKVRDKQKDRQSHEILTPYTGVGEIFFLVKICYLPTRFARRGGYEICHKNFTST